MEAATHQPLLDRPKTSYCKILSLVLLSLVAITSSTLLVSTGFIKTSSFSPSLLSLASNAADDVKNVNQLQIFLEESRLHIQNAMKMANQIKHRINNPREAAALADCGELMDLSMDRIMDSMKALKRQDVDSHDDSHSWLSSVLTNHVTCLDGLKDSGSGSASSAWTLMQPELNDLISRAKASLAIFVAISPSRKPKLIEPLADGLPSWVSSRDRKLLQALPRDIKANAVVAKDGSGNHKTVKAAVEAAPSKSKTRYVIYVKQGTYKENVEIGKSKKNLMIVGDGMEKTIITGSLNVVDGSTTFNSATVAATGDGFIAQDIWFQNTAGPQKHQAVALRVGADQSVINRCKIDAYQDTLYAHSNRQFYRDCSIIGTVDFIFGDSAVVLQNCKITARKPMDGQKNMVTAQGRIDPNQNTGTSIQKCNITASNDLEAVKKTIKTFLGRPWKEYSRTVVMQSYIGDHIDPTGWAPWDGDFALKTLYYGEYMNTGPSAGTSKRVNWAGFHVITSAAEAKKFTVAELIQGVSWLKSTGVAYTEGL